MPCQEAGQLLGPGGQGMALGRDRGGDTGHGLGNHPLRLGSGFRCQLMQELGRHVDAHRTGEIGLGRQTQERQPRPARLRQSDRRIEAGFRGPALSDMHQQIRHSHRTVSLFSVESAPEQAGQPLVERRPLHQGTRGAHRSSLHWPAGRAEAGLSC